MVWLKYLIPFASAILFRLGGVGGDDRFLPFMKPPTPIAAKVWRWLGIGIMLALIYKSLWPIATYFIATNVFAYGEKSWMRKIMPKHWAWYIYGLVFGLASFPVLGAFAIIQGAIAGTIFLALMQWSNDGYQKPGYPKTYLDHAYVEIGIGFFGMVMYLLK